LCPFYFISTFPSGFWSSESVWITGTVDVNGQRGLRIASDQPFLVQTISPFGVPFISPLTILIVPRFSLGPPWMFIGFMQVTIFLHVSI